MSFSFGFSGDDIENDGEQDDLADEMSKHAISESQMSSVDSIEAKAHSLQELVSLNIVQEVSKASKMSVVWFKIGKVYRGSSAKKDYSAFAVTNYQESRTN